MRARCGFRLLAAGFLACLVALSPVRAHAQSTTATMCDDGSFDKDYQQNREAQEQGMLTLAENINSMFPIAPAMNQCMQNIMNAMTKLPSLADPLNLAQSIVNPLIQGLIGQVCSQVMSTISSAQNAVSQMAKICLPMPQFNINLDLPSFSAQGCSGGTSVSLINGFSSPPRTSYDYSQYLGQ